jgi:hypothetical protein
MKRAAAVAAVTLAASLVSGAASARCRISRDYEGEERSWVGWSPNEVGYRDYDGWDKTSWMILSAQMSLTVPIGFACNTPQYGEYLWQLLPSMNLDFTQIADHSSQVFPPSFNPRIIRGGFRYRWWPGAPKDYSGRYNKRGVEWAVGALLSGWSHHSNGQFRPSYFDAAGTPTDDLGQAAAVNLDDGNFGTNYVSGKLWFRRSRLDENGDRPKEGWFGSVEYQFHHDAIFPGGLDETNIGPIWGRNHLLATLLYRSGYEHDWKNRVAPSDDYGGIYWLVSLDGWCALDAERRAFMTSWPCRGALEGAWFVPKFMGPAGVFARVDAGRSPLNIRFVENRNELIFGLMIDTSQSISRLPRPVDR